MNILIILKVLFFSVTCLAQVEFNWGMLESLEEYEKISTEFKKNIESTTNGAIRINIKKFKSDPGNPLLEITDGHLQIYQVPVSLLPNLLPNKNPEWILAWQLPFLFENKNHVEAYIKSNHSKMRIDSLTSDKILPLTYSYAGGFTAVLSRRGTNIVDFSDLKFCPFSDFDSSKMNRKSTIKLITSLPCQILLYELQELFVFSKNLKKELKVHLTNHHVESRLTFISKDHIAKIPEKYRQEFINKLRNLLDDERHAIYARSEKNLKLIQIDKDIEISHWDLRKRSLAIDDYIKGTSATSKVFKEEAGFIKNLLK